MEFLLYLSSAGLDVYNLISQKVKVIENAPICRQHEIFGWYQSDKNYMVVCTNNIKNHGNVSEYVNETVLHESVHIAQACKSKSQYIEPFGIDTQLMSLTDRRKNDVNSAVKINGSQVRQIEHEAFWMENKPDKVKYVLQKYCF